MSKERTRRIALISAPWALLLSTYVTYQWAAAAFGPKLGYLTGFLFYWLVWCFAFPLWVLGGGGLRAMFRDLQPRFTSRRWLGIML